MRPQQITIRHKFIPVTRDIKVLVNLVRMLRQQRNRITLDITMIIAITMRQHQDIRRMLDRQARVEVKVFTHQPDYQVNSLLNIWSILTNTLKRKFYTYRKSIRSASHRNNSYSISSFSFPALTTLYLPK